MENKEAIALLDRYLENECTAKERLLVELAYDLESLEADEGPVEEGYLDKQIKASVYYLATLQDLINQEGNVQNINSGRTFCDFF